jgi:hypothetical protein
VANAQTLPADYFEQRPACVRLRALGEIYAVRYQATADARIRIADVDRSLIIIRSAVRVRPGESRKTEAYIHLSILCFLASQQ